MQAFATLLPPRPLAEVPVHTPAGCSVRSTCSAVAAARPRRVVVFESSFLPAIPRFQAARAQRIAVTSTAGRRAVSLLAESKSSADASADASTAPRTDTPVVTVRDLRKAYGDKIAVDGVSLDVYPGEIFGLLGPNAAGKTTTLMAITTLLKPDSGEIKICGYDTRTQGREARASLGYIGQDFAVDKVLTGREHMELICGLYHLPREHAKQAIEFVTKFVGLEDYVDELTGTYSGGIRKRLDIALGILHGPEVLILDEPTVGLDIESRQALWRLIRELREEGVGILLTSHYLDEVDMLADRLAIINDGRIIAQGTPSELKDSLGGDRITLRIREFTPTEEADRVRDALQKLPCVRSAIVNSSQYNTIGLVVDAGPNSLAEVQGALRALDVPLFSITQSRPSLDDVYLEATGRTLADADLENKERREAEAKAKKAKKSTPKPLNKPKA
eukprot:tig00020614_g12159.t1